MTERRGLAGTLAAAVAVLAMAWLVVQGGAAARARHRWAVTVWRVDGRPAAALWRGRPDGTDASPVRASPPAARLTLAPGRLVARAEVSLPELDVEPGPVTLAAHVVWDAGGASGPGLSLAIGAPEPDGRALDSGGVERAIEGTRTASPHGPHGESGESEVRATFEHAGGPIRRLSVWLRAPLSAPVARSVLIGGVSLTTSTGRRP